MTEISEAARRLKELREQAGLTMRAVSEALGWSLTRYQHYEDRYKRRFLPFELARELDALFCQHGTEPGAVLQLAGIEPGQGVSQRRDPVPPRPGAAIGQTQRDLPVLGAVKGGSEGFYFNDGEAKEFVERPANLKGVFNGFALYVDGDSMEPRYFAGELLYVNPNRPITRNCFVAVELNDGQGLIKQFVRRTDEEIVLHQFNPARDITLRAGEVKRIYRITGTGEAG
ncbi:phage repressor protein C with HTH and peptisase S24 domain [Dongia mobilis]|uniref:Phage repressor protein C with HTH and peptisase S24 domain n=1 Tax=Dongia mobilis TaxID=578943 RepID=A0A4R6WSA9_9PROT|nr:XRE family transcriptional regulator [Dongia mobilis]TDQ82497.1 phage repressor protein C with HTH and peptisase S24 domain [Dongia mobilis]